MDFKSFFAKPDANKAPPVPLAESSPSENAHLTALDSSRNPFISWPTFVDWIATQLNLPPPYQPPPSVTESSSSALSPTVVSPSTVSPGNEHLPFFDFFLPSPRHRDPLLLLPPPPPPGKKLETANPLNIFEQFWDKVVGGGKKEVSTSKQDGTKLSGIEVPSDTEANPGSIPVELLISEIQEEVILAVVGAREGPEALTSAFTPEELEVLNQIREVVASGDGTGTPISNEKSPGGTDVSRSDSRWWEAIEQSKEEGGREGEGSSSPSSSSLLLFPTEREKLMDAIQVAEESAALLKEEGRDGEESALLESHVVVRIRGGGEAGVVLLEGDESYNPWKEGQRRVRRWVGRSGEDESAARLRLLEKILEEERKKMFVRKSGSKKVKESWEAIVQKEKEKQVAIEREKTESREQVAAMCRSGSSPLLKRSATQNQKAVLQGMPSSLTPADEIGLAMEIA